MDSSRPNIVYIMTDQQSFDAMSCAGRSGPATPAMDLLAAEGLRFEYAYCAYPLCVPARTAMFSGRMPHEMGIFGNVKARADSCPFPMLGRRLAEAGYHNHYVGKWHLTVPEDAREQHGLGEIVLGGGYGKTDHEKTEAALAFIEQAPPGPFFLTVSYNNPHDACELSRGDPMKMEPLPPWPEDSALPPLPENHALLPDEPTALRDFQRNHPRIFPSLDWDERQTRRFRWGYDRLVEMVDREIGRVIAALRERGLWENTLIVFTSDHGDGRGEHRWNQKWSHYDASSRVPFLLIDPDRRRAGEVESQPVSATLDLFPTLCDYAGATPPESLHGTSLRPALAGEPLQRDYVVSEVSFQTWAELHQDDAPKARMVVSGQHYKYIAYDTGGNREQLFNLREDPLETRNLAKEPAHAGTLADLRAHLRAWFARTGDSFVPPPNGG